MNIGGILLAVSINSIVLAASIWLVLRHEPRIDTGAIIKAVIGVAAVSCILGLLLSKINLVIIIFLYLTVSSVIIWKCCYLPFKRASLASFIYFILSIIVWGSVKSLSQ